MKIQKRLLISILPVVLVAVFLVTFISIQLSTNAVEKQVKDNTRLLSKSYSNQLNSEIMHFKRMASDISSAIETAVNVETVLINAKKRYHEISRVLYTTVDGSIKDMSPYSPGLLSQNYKYDTDWLNAIATKEIVISDPKVYMQEKVFFIYSPVVIDYVINKEPEVVGVAIFVIPVEYMFEDFSDVVYGETGSVFVINEMADFIHHKNSDYILSKKLTDIPNTTDLGRIEISMVSGYSGMATIYQDGVKSFISFYPVPATGWSLAIMGAYTEFSSKVRSLVVINILILIGALILASFTIYILVHGVVRPIEELTVMADKISHGDTSVRAEIETSSEIGILSKSINIMVDQLEDHNIRLEKLVQERTSELVASNEELKTANENVAAMNEELRVTNETLDTNAKEIAAMNEELRVTNESLDDQNKEMETINEELTATVEELDRSNRELEVARNALWGEMELAKKLQTVLLPEDPQIQGYDIAAFMKTTDAVGGDYYDVINICGKDWFLIGDVSGHGVTAGLIMMMVQTSIHVVLSQNPHSKPEDLLSVINRTIHSNIHKLGGNRYMTLTVFACLDHNRLSFAGAHLPAIIYRKESDSIEFLETDGAWIGLIDEVSHLNSDSEFYMNIGDTLLLYTDGITEGESEDGKQFTQQGLADLLMEYRNDDSKKICDSIENYSTKLKIDDDISVLVLKKVS